MTGCRQKDYFDPEAYNEIIYKAFPVNGVDPAHEWKTMRTVTAHVTVSWMHQGNYTVELYDSNPQESGTHMTMGRATVANGSTVNIPMPYPLGGPEVLYVALTDPYGHRTVKTARIAAGTLQCGFYATGNGINESTPYSVTLIERPESPVSDADAGTSIYITDTWTLSESYAIDNGCTVVVADGGRIVIPDGMTLSVAPQTETETAGRLCVMHGGSVSGGQIVLGADGCANGNSAPAIYNGGVLETGSIEMNGATVYNADGATLGITELRAGRKGSRLVNRGYAKIGRAGNASDASDMKFAYLTIENACKMDISGHITIGSASRMGRGSWMTCGSMTLAGTKNGQERLYMGPDAYIGCDGPTDIIYFGLCGPAADGYAIVSMREAGTTAINDGIREQYITNRIDIASPQASGTGEKIMPLCCGNNMTGSMYWTETEKSVVMSASAPYTKEADECSGGFESLTDETVDAVPFGARFFFEDSFPMEGDYDFNDLVMTVIPRISGRDVTLTVTLDAVGTAKQMAAALRVKSVSTAEVTDAWMEGDFDFNNGKPVSSYMIIDSKEWLLPEDKKRTGDVVINLFSDAHWALSHTMESNGNIRRWLYNTVGQTDTDSRNDCADVPPVSVTYHLTMASEDAAARFVPENLDAFVIESTNGMFVEEHTWPFKTEQVIYQYIKDPANYAGSFIWAMQVPSPTRWPLEGVRIGSNRGGLISGAFQTPGHSFCEWAISRNKATDWWEYPTQGMVK